MMVRVARGAAGAAPSGRRNAFPLAPLPIVHGWGALV